MKRTAIAVGLLSAGGIMTMAGTGGEPPRITTRTVEYRDGAAVLEGFLARPDGKDAAVRPGVIVVHEWFGLGDHARESAEKLARMGYVALAADIYGKGVRAKTNEEAAKLAALYRGGDRENLRARMRAALSVLRAQPGVDPRRIAAIGYCFGGSAVLELARDGADAAGVVSFHGGLAPAATPDPRPAVKGKIRARVLALHGADDPFVPADEVRSFQEEMRAAGADWQFVSYGGAVHSFTNPAAGNDNSKGAAYNTDADRRSWEAMRAFLAEIFSPGAGR